MIIEKIVVLSCLNHHPEKSPRWDSQRADLMYEVLKDAAPTAFLCKLSVFLFY